MKEDAILLKNKCQTKTRVMEILSLHECESINGGGAVHYALGYIYEVVKTACEKLVEIAMDNAIENALDGTAND